MDIHEFLEDGEKHYLPNLSVDLVVIGYQEGNLKCLLLKLGQKWILPGGHIEKSESVDNAVVRILKERTTLDDPHFKFLKVFGAPDRRFNREFKTYFDNNGLPWREDYWINDRFVTLAHYSLVDMDNVHPVVGDFGEAVRWFSFEELPELWLDHKTIIETAQNQLKEDVKKELLSYNLLADSFTMPQLHQLHQTILQENLDRSRFQKKMLATGRFERLPKLKKESPGSNPYQYRLKN